MGRATLIVGLSFFVVIIFSVSFVGRGLGPFLFSFITSYLLYPKIRSISMNIRCNENITIAMVCVLLFVTFMSIVFVFLPKILHQMIFLVRSISVYIEKINLENEMSFVPEILSLKIDIKQIFHKTGLLVVSHSTEILNSLSSYFLSVTKYIVYFLLVPLFSFFVLSKWEIILQNFYDLIPRKYLISIQKILKEIDEVISAYIGGQIIISGILSIYYITSLSILGLNFSVLLGFGAGIAIFIPILGIFSVVTVSLIIGCIQFNLSPAILYLSIIFIVGNIIETYCLTPKILGEKVGLHPLFILLSLFMCGGIGGILGLIFAIPIAGILKILIKYSLQAYKQTLFYKDNNID